MARVCLMLIVLGYCPSFSGFRCGHSTTTALGSVIEDDVSDDGGEDDDACPNGFFEDV
jgi:hypothetical protein